MLKKFSLGFGDREVTVALPEEQVLDCIEGNTAMPVEDIPGAVQAAIRHPIGTPLLPDIVKHGDKVTIVVSDITREWIRYDLFLTVLLDELNQAGIPDSDITLVVALGTHRYHTQEENIQTYGREAVERVRIVQSFSRKEEDFVPLGQTTRGTAICIHKDVASADKVILTGGIVYHLMAGFGGGPKSIMPGVSSYASIQANHSFCLHQETGRGTSPECASGKLIDNPMHEDVVEIARKVNPAFLLNAVLTPDGRFARFVAGHWYEAWREGTKTVERIYGVPASGKSDLVIASAGGFPKDMNLYQGSKTIDNAFMAVKPDGAAIILLECRDIAEPPEFSDWFGYTSLYEREQALRQAFTVPGFIALKLGIMAKQTPLIIVSLPQNKEFIEKTGLLFSASLEEAIAMAEEKIGRKQYTVTVMPHAANIMPIASA